jgi:hypothetical protein
MELREQAQGIFAGQKRRRGSWALYFLGDYIRAQESPELSSVLTKSGDSRILFADIVEKVNRKKKVQRRALVITSNALYTLTPDKYKPTNAVPLAAIEGVAMSTFADGFFVLKVKAGAVKDTPADLILNSVRKAEILTALVRARSDSRLPELKLSFADRLEIRFKKGGGFFGNSQVESRTLSFVEDGGLGASKEAVAELVAPESDKAGPITVRVSPALGSLASIQLNATTPKVAWSAAKTKDGAASAGGAQLKRGYSRGGGAGGGAYGQVMGRGKAGVAANAAPFGAGGASGGAAPPVPPPPSANRRSFSSFPLAQTMFPFNGSGGEQLSLAAGVVVHVIEKGSDEWLTVEHEGKVGLVPSNFIKML